jgi:hypothetical protein
MSTQSAAARIVGPEAFEPPRRGVRRQIEANVATVAAAETVHLDAVIGDEGWERRGLLRRLVRRESGQL